MRKIKGYTNRFDEAIKEINTCNKKEAVLEQNIPRSLQYLFNPNKDPNNKRHNQLIEHEEIEFYKNGFENDIAFMHRIDKTAQQAIMQSKLETKYGCSLEDVNNQDNMTRSKSENKKRKDKARKKEKLTRKFIRQSDRVDNFALPSEAIKFGTTVSCPPQLTHKPKLKNTFTKKSSRRDLKLFSLLSNDT